MQSYAFYFARQNIGFTFELICLQNGIIHTTLIFTPPIVKTLKKEQIVIKNAKKRE